MALPDTKNAFTLKFPQSLAVYENYDEAQRAVDFLADSQFPVENILIVGTDLKQVERVTGRLTWGKVALAGLLTGAWVGLFIGVIFGLWAERGEWLAVVLNAALIGAVFGIVWALFGFALSGGRRDFASVTQVMATKYELLVEHNLLADGQARLAQMPAKKA